MTKVSVVIPVFNQCHLTVRCLSSLIKHSQHLHQVCVVDNASQDDTAAILLEFKTQFDASGVGFQIITNTKNQGFGRACNQGVRAFLQDDSQYLVILNNDTWLMPYWDQALVSALTEHKLDCVGPYFYEKPYSENLRNIAASFVKRNAGRTRHHFVPILMMFKRESIQRLSEDGNGSIGGIFDERYFVTYEDTDLLTRMKKLNMRYAQTGSCFIWHHSKGTRDKLPSGYEQEGLKLFIEKWHFDPRAQDHTFSARLKRRFWVMLDHMGIF